MKVWQYKKIKEKEGVKLWGVFELRYYWNPKANSWNEWKREYGNFCSKKEGVGSCCGICCTWEEKGAIFLTFPTFTHGNLPLYIYIYMVHHLQRQSYKGRVNP